MQRTYNAEPVVFRTPGRLDQDQDIYSPLFSLVMSHLSWVQLFDNRSLGSPLTTCVTLIHRLHLQFVCMPDQGKLRSRQTSRYCIVQTEKQEHSNDYNV